MYLIFLIQLIIIYIFLIRKIINFFKNYIHILMYYNCTQNMENMVNKNESYLLVGGIQCY